jgi:hypothetical protein
MSADRTSPTRVLTQSGRARCGPTSLRRYGEVRTSFSLPQENPKVPSLGFWRFRGHAHAAERVRRANGALDRGLRDGRPLLYAWSLRRGGGTIIEHCSRAALQHGLTIVDRITERRFCAAVRDRPALALPSKRLLLAVGCLLGPRHMRDEPSWQRPDEFILSLAGGGARC